MTEGACDGADSFLLLDGSRSPALAALVGVHAKKCIQWRRGQSLNGFFSAVEGVLREGGVGWSGLAGVLVNGGPGNLMGLRAAKSLIDTAGALGWRISIRSFCGPEWVARWILERGGPCSFRLLVPITRRRYFELTAEDGKLGSLVCCEGSASAGDGPTYLISTRDNIALPVGARWAPYPPPQFFFDRLELLQPTEIFCPFDER